MQSMLYGLGSGGRIFTFLAGMPRPPAAAFSSFLRYSAKRSIRPLIKSCGPVCGMPFTVFDTSTTVSPFSTPSLKSSKYKSFISSPSVWRSFGRQRDERSGLNSRMKFHSGMSPTLVTAWMIGSRKFTTLAGSCGASLPSMIWRSSGPWLMRFRSEVPQRHVADVGYGVDDRLAEVHHARRFLRRVLAVDDLAQQRSLVDADLDALAMAVAVARVSRGEPLLVDEKALALVHDRIFRGRDDLGGRFDRRAIRFDRDLEIGARVRRPVGFARPEHRDLTASHRAQHFAEA